MQTAGLMLAILGSLLLAGSAFALSLTQAGKKPSVAEAADTFILGGAVTFLRNLIRAIAEGLRNRSSPSFPPLALFGISLGLVSVGAILLWAAGA